MRIGHSSIRSAFVASICTCALSAWAAGDGVATSVVDARAPLAAVLLPTVTVTASNPHAPLQVAAEPALPVTLLPTVHVHASVSSSTRAHRAGEPVVAAADLPTVAARLVLPM